MNAHTHGSEGRGDDPRGSAWDVLAKPYHGEVGAAPPWIVQYLDGSNVPGDRIRLGDPATRTYVILSKFMDRYVCAEIFEARGLSDVQRERLHALGWRLEATGTSQIRPTWTVSWTWYERDVEFLLGRAEAVIGALRDVLAVPPERLRCWTWGEDGPLDAPFRFRDRDERPTATGAPALCTDWEDLRRRLDWVLQTLPTDSAVILTDRDRGGVQFMSDRLGFMDTGALDYRPVSGELPDRDAPGNDRERRLFELGWTPETAGARSVSWTIGRPVVWADIGPLATQAVEVLRALGFHDPSELAVKTFRNGMGDEHVKHVAEELGIRPEKT
ncbi:TY-Chap domain-containing protein [Streptosporangium sp. NPDC050855]|uniref:TY-Chap domain-containing protein n=1 Tax=Streptosporangium sp. NPDC050855 TaxID=3366194 RepID=UPI00378B2BA6